MDEQRHFEALTREECLAILARHGYGRLAVSVDGQPDIFPVNYLLDGDKVIFRTAAGTKLAHASLDRVAFEVDELENDHSAACSVVVKGTALEFTEGIDQRSEDERQLELHTLIGTKGQDHWVRIVPREITGRQVVGE